MTSNNGATHHQNNIMPQDSRQVSKYCLFLPYQDGFLIAARILPIVALVVSVWNPVSLILSALATVWIQIVWCCKPNKTWVTTSGLVCLAAGVGCLFVGLEVMPPRNMLGSSSGASNNIFHDDDDDDDNGNLPNDDNGSNNSGISSNTADKNPCGMLCQTSTVGWITSFCSGFLWLLTTWCIIRLLRRDNLEAPNRHNNTIIRANQSNDERAIPESFPASKAGEVELPSLPR